MTIENNRVQYHHNYLITEARHTSQTRKVNPAYACMHVQINTYVLTFLLFLRTSYEYRVYTLILKKFSRGRADAYKEKTRCRYGLSDRFKAGQNQLNARQSRKKQVYLGLFEPKSDTVPAWPRAGLLACVLSLFKECN